MKWHVSVCPLHAYKETRAFAQRLPAELLPTKVFNYKRISTDCTLACTYLCICFGPVQCVVTEQWDEQIAYSGHIHFWFANRIGKHKETRHFQKCVNAGMSALSCKMQNLAHLAHLAHINNGSLFTHQCTAACKNYVLLFIVHPNLRFNTQHHQM
jgi:hypothetical protein